MNDILQQAVTVSSYITVGAVLTFVYFYSIYYSWYKSPLGIALNASLLSTMLQAIGMILILQFGLINLGAVLVMAGLLGFVMAIGARTQILVCDARKWREERRNTELKSDPSI